ncbi:MULTISPECIES: GolD/DthD family dehydrogenase [Edwardsiella]|uniref:GolD/DthD family dehydrogenase n=1 Tax=Edwardsiella TaxID=635 RepID=UPI00045C87DA|nr:D-threitol dehydrogenase [Edwardsiella anguillarum]RFT01985.1 D-threitol dehydrogenase [Edwardsiella anguillarum]WHQ13015.1 D-threitol dehydrogenase [Edwardsiella anguillarum]BET90424.1 D-threitol dehydrogenase [Edwardsiella anguillarum]GAJ66406.1 oxidoreductase, short chain dehydrogenase/reductase family [Edwardsiella piscicida]
MMTHECRAPFSLRGKVAVITGGAAGIGQAIAACYVQGGASVVLLDRDLRVATVARQLDAQNALGLEVDVCDRGALQSAAAQALRHFGHIDVLVNSAGIVALAPAAALSEADWAATMSINVTGTFLACQVIGAYLLRQRAGSIINLASQAGVVALPHHAAYCASKAAVIGLTQVLALEWGVDNVRVNALSPTVVLTDLGRRAWSGEKAERMKAAIPLRRFAEPNDVAACALFLASDAASMVTGANLRVDGGYTIQ